MKTAITAIVVSFGDPAASRRAIESLVDQSLAPAEVVVIDNAAKAAVLDVGPTSTNASNIRILRPGENLGYTRAANLAAREATGEWLFFLNPDAVASKDCLMRLLEAVDRADVAVVGAQVLLTDGRVNAGDNPINIAGISWSGGYGRPREYGPARDTAAVSGAALMVRRDAFLGIGGLCPHFFMYVDDADLAWRLRLAGRRVRYCPAAVVVHDYEFEKGTHKWFYLERNRAWALLSNLELRTLALLAPVLLMAELIILARAVSEGWLAEKGQAWRSLIGQAPELIRWRRRVQSTRYVSDYRVLELFSAGIDTRLININTWLQGWVNGFLRTYRLVLLRLLRQAED
jgi:GT2 family glycosyltransferase